MQEVNLKVEDILLEFYKKVATHADKSLEEVMADALKRFALDVCVSLHNG